MRWLLIGMATDLNLFCFFINLLTTSKNINDFDKLKYQFRTINETGSKYTKHVDRAPSLGYLTPLEKFSTSIDTSWIGNKSELWHCMVSCKLQKMTEMRVVTYGAERCPVSHKNSDGTSEPQKMN